jgi:uncharacterized protein
LAGDERKIIEGYNTDDCLSTKSLRDWFERERETLEKEGRTISRPPILDGAPPATIDERQERIADLANALINGVPADAGQRTEEQSARWLLAALLDWHRREDKASWWEYFRLKDLADDDLFDERDALSGLQFVKRVGMDKKIPVDRYQFAKQETNIRTGDTVCQRGERIGNVVGFDQASRWIEIKKTRKTSDVHPSSVVVDPTGPRTDVLADSLFRLGEWVKDNWRSWTVGPYRRVYGGCCQTTWGLARSFGLSHSGPPKCR